MWPWLSVPGVALAAWVRYRVRFPISDSVGGLNFVAFVFDGVSNVMIFGVLAFFERTQRAVPIIMITFLP